MKTRFVVETYGGNPREVYRADTETQCLEWIVEQINDKPNVHREYAIRTIYTTTE